MDNESLTLCIFISIGIVSGSGGEYVWDPLVGATIGFFWGTLSIVITRLWRNRGNAIRSLAPSKSRLATSRSTNEDEQMD